MRRSVVGAALAAIVVGGVVAYLHQQAPPACGSDPVLGQVYATLRDRDHLDSIFLNDIKTLAGGYFSDRYDCAAEVTEIRGNVTASGMGWRAVHYQIVHQDAPPGMAVTVELGGSVPLAPKAPTFWQRVLAYL